MNEPKTEPASQGDKQASLPQNAVSNTESKLSILDRLYAENSESYRCFLEWRHKILLRYLFIIGAALIVAKGVLDYKSEFSNYGLLIPPLIIFIGSLASYGMDRRNAAVLGNAVLIGTELEREMLHIGGFTNSILSTRPFYTRLKEERKNVTFTYSKILEIIYLSTTTIGLIATLLVATTIMGTRSEIVSEKADCTQAEIYPKSPQVHD